MANISELKISDTINNYYLTDNSNFYEQKIKFNLLSICSKIKNITNDNNRQTVLTNYENSIYNVNDKKISESEKISFEIKKIIKYLENNPTQNNEYVENILNNITNKKSQDNSKTKKDIVKLQILLDRDITFYKETYNLYLDYFKK